MTRQEKARRWERRANRKTSCISKNNPDLQIGYDARQIGPWRDELIFDRGDALRQLFAQARHVGAKVEQRGLAFRYLAKDVTGPRSPSMSCSISDTRRRTSAMLVSSAMA